MSRSIQRAPSSSEDEEETEGSVERWNLLYRDFSRLHKRCEEGNAEGIRGPPEVATILEYILLYRYQKSPVIKLGRNGLVVERLLILYTACTYSIFFYLIPPC